MRSTKKVSRAFVECAALLAALPPSVDRGGERSEFHTFCYGGPILAATLAVRAGEGFVRDGLPIRIRGCL
jgi:hypothetical protein